MSPSTGTTTPAFRYFVFILSLCLVLFIFLMARLAGGVESRPDFENHTQTVHQIAV